MLSVEETLALATPTPEVKELLITNPSHIGGWTMNTDIDLLRNITAQISAAQRLRGPDPSTLPYMEEDTHISTRDGSTIRIRIHKPRHKPKDGCPALVAFHGGGFVIGTVENSTSFCRLFTSLGGIAVNVEYRLAPEHPFPTPVNDCYDAVKWTVENAKNLGINLEKGFLVGGESAGADLAQGVAYLYGKEKLSPPLTGVYSSVSSAAIEETIPEKFRDRFLSVEQNSYAPVITKESLQLIRAKYKPDPKSHLAYPIMSPDLGRYMPKTYFQACGMDPLRDCTLIMNETPVRSGVIAGALNALTIARRDKTGPPFQLTSPYNSSRPCPPSPPYSARTAKYAHQSTMAPKSKPPEKQQQSLTSFFKPKTVNGLAAAFQKSQSESKASPSKSPETPRKRPLEEDADKGNNGPEKASKRTKADTDKNQDVPNAEKSSSFSAEGKQTNREPKAGTAVSGSRTGRFVYSQTSDGNIEDLLEDDPVTKRTKEELHKKFVKKLGHPDSMLWRRRREDDNEAGDGDDGAGEDDEEDEAPPPTKAKKGGARASKKLTPMEIQFLDIKRKHLDTVLIVEVGYKFRFFGEDARIAAKELSIVCIPGKYRYDEHPSEAHWDRFASASIPVHRLSVHAKRLVAAGHKVGVVRQIETAALKKAGDNRNTPFIRKLTNVYTKGTYIDENGELDNSGESGAPSGGYLLCITENPTKGQGTDEKVEVGIVAVQPATGDIIYDTFEDGFMRSEIETRLLHISPCEFVIVGNLTKGSDKLIQHLSGSSTNVFGDKSRVERVPASKTMAAEAYSHVTQFYAEKLQQTPDAAASSLLDRILHLPEPVTICLSAMITHLKEYGLEHVFDLTKNFTSFSARQHMLLNGTTLESLEVYRNATDHSERGSLFWALDKTTTRFGQRLLRKWVGRPLLDVSHLEARVAAVQELLDEQSSAKAERVQSLLSSIKTDLERSLIRIYYGKCTRPELLSVLQTLQRIAMQYSTVKSVEETGFTSPLLTSAILSLPQILDLVVSYLEKINPEAARKDDKYNFFRESEQTEDIEDHKMGIVSVEQSLDDHRAEAATSIKRKKPVDYVTVSGIEYLIEVANTDLKAVPASWIKISGTKKLSRFHTPTVVRLIQERDQHREALAAACDAAFTALLREIADAYQPLRDAVSSLATLDCLLSLSRVAALPGYSKPTFLPSQTQPTISITQGRHPIAEHTLADPYIPFTTTLSSPSPLAQLITGPNMGGKSSFVRAVALLVLLAQIGSFVPADEFSLTLADAIHVRMGARDNLAAGESTFMVEVSETARILRAATPRSLVILDELGRGTSTHDGAAIAHAVLDHVVRENRCLTLFITHYQNLARLADGIGDGLVKNVHMRFTATRGAAVEDSKDHEDADADEEITFLYEVGEGVAHRSYGLNVARLARIPRKVIEVAAQKSREMEQDVRMRRLRGTARLLSDVLTDRPDQLEHLISNVEQL
ncbi:MutS domain V [Colletotrichum truncatum]|uniref:MutS domain V n=1 Tax=Colletotrichum truncatum TaxID=5467 RepID=A0ACC3Z3Q3_COLTU